MTVPFPGLSLVFTWLELDVLVSGGCVGLVAEFLSFALFSSIIQIGPISRQMNRNVPSDILQDTNRLKVGKLTQITQ